MALTSEPVCADLVVVVLVPCSINRHLDLWDIHCVEGKHLVRVIEVKSFSALRKVVQLCLERVRSPVDLVPVPLNALYTSAQEQVSISNEVDGAGGRSAGGN